MFLVFTWPIIKYSYKSTLYIIQISKKIILLVENLDLSQIGTVNQELNKVKSSAEGYERIEMTLSKLRTEIISEVKSNINSLDMKLETSIRSLEKQINSLDTRIRLPRYEARKTDQLPRYKARNQYPFPRKRDQLPRYEARKEKPFSRQTD